MDLKDLKIIAQGATQGEWTHVEESITYKWTNKVTGKDVTEILIQDDGLTQSDYRYISTFNPQLIGKLLDIAEAAEKIPGTIDEDCDSTVAQVIANDKLKEAISSLKEMK